MVRIWATLIINGDMVFTDVPPKSQPATHNQLLAWGYNDDGTPIEGVSQTMVAAPTV